MEDTGMNDTATVNVTPKHSMLVATLVATLTLVSLSCGGGDNAPRTTPDSSNVIEISIIGLAFDGPDTVSSGWTTIRLKNTSGMTHFAILERLPEGIGIEEQQREIAPVFQAGMNLLNEGKADEATEMFGTLPEWFYDVVFTGGVGFISPWQTAEMTVLLEPGRYLLECYVKTVGVFHSFNPIPDLYGMVHEITVTEEASGAPEPEADIELTISTERGIEVEGDIGLGRHTVAVHFEDQVVYDHFLGHDVHLARLTENTDLDALEAWMDWTQPRGLETPAPAEFLGGLHEMPAGQTGYFVIDLEPGSYAWIAEVPDPAGKVMLKTFSTSVRGGR